MLATTSHFSGKHAFDQLTDEIKDALMELASKFKTIIHNGKVEFVVNDRKLSMYTSVANFLKNAEQAIMINQLHWLLTQASEGKYGFFVGTKDENNDFEHHKWVRESYKQLSEKHFTWISQQVVGSHMRRLESLGWVISDNHNCTGYDQTKWYRLNYEKIIADSGWQPYGMSILFNQTLEYKRENNVPYTEKDHKQQLENLCLRKENAELVPKTGYTDEETLAGIPQKVEEYHDKIASTPFVEPDEATKKERLLKSEGLYSGEMLRKVKNFALEEIQKAISLMRDRAKVVEIVNPKGFISQCLKFKWWEDKELPDSLKPVPAQEVEPPQGFDHWFELAKEAKMISVSDRIENLAKISNELIIQIREGESYAQTIAMGVVTAMREYPEAVLRAKINRLRSIQT